MPCGRNNDLRKILEDSDCWYDLSSCRGVKRRRNENPLYCDFKSKRVSESKSVKSEEVWIDQEYKAFLDHMMELGGFDKGDRGYGMKEDHMKEFRGFDKGIDRIDRSYGMKDEYHGNSNAHKVDNVDGNGDDNEVVDPDYKIFLDNCRKDNYSYVLEMTKNDGTTVSIRYEDDCGGSIDRGKAPLIALKEKSKLKPSNYRIEDSRMFLSDCKPEMISQADDSYIGYLSNVRIKGLSLFYETEDCVKELGEEVQTGGTRCRNEDKFRANANRGACNMNVDQESDDDCNSVESIQQIEVSSAFEEKLVGELVKPWDKKEFNELLKAAKAKKNLEHWRELRSRSLRYDTGLKSLSYLDYHPDLKALIKEAFSHRNKHGALFLLRSLFFYLKNCSMIGAFVPWKNPSILDKMP
ncbi:hypothetical protein Syun_003347 [Stephania yunnanensis]|uniref:Uncharacterized protein n=1 Tax=Stephania yunnanensis TaxID=152371 RepID=A0AAP0Q0I9_9MAGN